jgi:hypothetical protein
MNALNGKLGPAAVWLFAVTTLALVLGATHLIPSVVGPISPKAMAAVYFALFGAGAAAAVFVTRTRPLAAVSAFALAGLGLGIFYYIVVARTFAGAGEAVSTAMGMIFAIIFAVVALVAGVAGTVFGLQLRKGLPRTSALRG